MDSNSVQPSNESFFDILDVCCSKIVEKTGGKPIGEWRTEDYNSLSSQLGKHTKVYLSANTLKRIFGRLKTSTRYYPQKATRDALAQFIGYRDWKEFELVHSVMAIKSSEPIFLSEKEAVMESIVDQKDVVEKPSTNMISILVVLISFLVISACLIYIFRTSYVDPKNVSLVCENPFGQVPHTAVFKLASKQPIDETEQFSIDFMDEARTAKISGKKELTQFFRNPGVVYVKLLYKGKVIDTTTVFMQTKGWVANSGNDTSNAFPIAGLHSLSTDRIYVSPQQLDSAGLDVSKPFLIGFSNIHASNISGENFEFSCNLQSEESRPGVQCIESTIIILGEKSRHLVKIYKPSCAAFSEYMFSEVNVNGSSKYLGAMGYDFANGGKVVLRVQNKVVSLFIEGKQVLGTKYQSSIGKVMGIKVLFNGIGHLREPKLTDLKTKELY